MNAMKKAGLWLLTALLLTGCQTNTKPDETEEQAKPREGDAYTLYSEDLAGAEKASSLSYGIRSDYTFRFSDDTLSSYQMDGVLEVQDESETAHLTQNIHANGLNSQMEAYFYDGTLYNSYNGITYYEKMNLNNVRELMLVPLEAYAFPQQIISSIKASEDTEGNHIYVIEIAEESRKDFFGSRYDFYGVTEFDDAEVKALTVTDSFSSDGYLISENVSAETAFTYQEQEIEASYTSEVSLFAQNSTEIAISDELKKEQSAYVSSDEIDTSQIDTGDDYDDSPEATTAATFRKRLIGRMGYEEIEGDAVQMKFNQNEAYTIDFANKTFIYSNYSINYVYSWQGDLISMGSCTYEFGKDRATSECQDSTVEKMKEVKNYLLMELYYCGLSLDDLQSETK